MRTAVKFGADPEFMLACDNRPYPAKKILCFDHRIGTDGNAHTGELRPRPSSSIYSVVADLQQMINLLAEHPIIVAKKITMHAGHSRFGFPLGGHVHIGEKLAPDKQAYLVSILDSLIFDIVDSIMGHPGQRRERESHGYGQRSEARNQPHGLEYRPCTSWLLSPDIALIFLGFTKMAYEAAALDIGVFSQSLKTFYTCYDRRREFSREVNHALDLFSHYVKNDLHLDWEADCFPAWSIKEGR